MEPEEKVNQFNTEASQQVEDISETIREVERGLETGGDLEEQIQQLHQDYRDLSKKEVHFLSESSDFTATKPLRPLRQPTRKDHEGSRGLDAHEPDLIEHKKYLDQKKEARLTEARHLYQRYRQERGLEPVEHELDIPSVIEELNLMKEGKENEIHSLRDYLVDLMKIETGDKTLEETGYHLPDNEALIDDQIEKTAERIYQEWEAIKEKQERIEEAFGNLEEGRQELEPIEIGIKYGLRPVESTYERVQRDINEIARDWDVLAESFREHLPQQYDQRIDTKAGA